MDINKNLILRNFKRLNRALLHSRGLQIVTAAHPVGAYNRKNFRACQLRLVVPGESAGRKVAWYNCTGSDIDRARGIVQLLDIAKSA